jgi:hypothetical protein
MNMKIAILGATAFALAGCLGNFTGEDVACVVTGFTNAQLAEGIDLAAAQKIAADCGVTVQTVVDAFAEASTEAAAK